MSNPYAICLKCDGESFHDDIREISQYFKGIGLLVKTPVIVCDNCGWVTVGNHQIDELIHNTKDIYNQLVNHE